MARMRSERNRASDPMTVRASDRQACGVDSCHLPVLLRRRDAHVRKFFRFVVSGGICFLLSFAILWFCTSALGLHYEVAIVAAFIAVNLVAFAINRIWAFEVRSGKSLPQLGRYYVVMLCSLLLCMLMMHALVEWVGLNYLIANVIASAVLLVGNFTAHTIWTFRLQSTVASTTE